MKMPNTRSVAVVLFLPLAANSAETTPLPTENSHWNASNQLEVGKVKIITLDELPAAMRRVTEGQMAERATGYESVPEEVFIHGRNYRNRIRQNGDAASKIKVKLSDVSKTALSSYRYEGFIPDGPTPDGPWTSVTRVFHRADGTLLMLHEWDYVSDGGGVLMVKEAMNTTVGGTPAQLSHKKSPSGNVLTELSWATKSKYYTLSVWGDVRSAGLNATINSQAQSDPITKEELSAIAVQLD